MVPGPEDVVSFLDAVHTLRNCVVPTICDSKGLRISEAVSRRPTDIDSRRMVARDEQGKGGNDRLVMLSPCLLETPREYWRRARPAGEWLFPGMICGRHSAGTLPNGPAKRPVARPASPSASRHTRLGRMSSPGLFRAVLDPCGQVY